MKVETRTRSLQKKIGFGQFGRSRAINRDEKRDFKLETIEQCPDAESDVSQHPNRSI